MGKFEHSTVRASRDIVTRRVSEGEVREGSHFLTSPSLTRRVTIAPAAYRPSVISLLLGIIAVLIVQVFRGGVHPNPWWVRIDAFIQLAIPVLILAGLIRRGKKGRTSEDASSKHFIQIGALLYSALPVLLQVITRSFFGVGDANEIVALLVLGNAAWYLAVLSFFRNFDRAGFLVASALVLFVCFTTTSWQIHGLALVYSVIAMWWLMGLYWNRLKSKLLDSSSRTLPVRSSFVIMSALIVGITGLIACNCEPIMQTISVSGFMPTSGGNQWSDGYAISGLGDGDMLAAGEDATTTGAVDSNQFIEDERSSIYDAYSEMFDEPVKRKKDRRNRAATLDVQAKHIHHAKRSEQAGRSFRVVRKKGQKRQKRDYEDIVSDALFFVEGSVPVRFSVNTFNHFDGWDWSHRQVEPNERRNEGIRIVEKNSKPWYVVQNQEQSYLPSCRGHRIKIMRLESSSFPSPPFLQRWHIYRVANSNMFSWGEEDIVQFDGLLPPQTMIDIVGGVPNYHVLRSNNNFTGRPFKTCFSRSWTGNSSEIFEENKCSEVLPLRLRGFEKPSGTFAADSTGVSQGSDFQIQPDSDSQFFQVPDDATKQRLRDLADEWTNGIEPGWNQVEAIVSRFRNDFEFDPQQVVPEDCDNAVDQFLSVRSGPSYLFASAAAQMLRAAGYKTRLATGFLVQKDDYVRTAGQSIVTNENVHVWPEVCIDNFHWIPLEPTPGFPVPFSTETIAQFVKRKFAEAFIWIGAHPVTSGMIVAALILLVRFRRKLFAGLWWLRWFAVFSLSARNRLRITRQLLDARFRAAGFPRPKSETIVRWFSQVDGNSRRHFYNYWLAANFGNCPLDQHGQPVAEACKELIRELPYAKIAEFVRQMKLKTGESR